MCDVQALPAAFVIVNVQFGVFDQGSPKVIVQDPLATFPIVVPGSLLSPIEADEEHVKL